MTTLLEEVDLGLAHDIFASDDEVGGEDPDEDLDDERLGGLELEDDDADLSDMDGFDDEE